MKKLNKKMIIIFGASILGVGIIAAIIAIIISASGSKLTSVTISGVSRTIYVGSIDNSTTSIAFSYAPTNVSVSELAIYSEDESIAVIDSIDSGNKLVVVKAVGKGETNVVVVSKKNRKIYDKCKIVTYDNTVESFDFVSGEGNDATIINSMQVKRDGYPYEVAFNMFPNTANISDENIEIIYDENVLSSVRLNREKRLLEVSARLDTTVESTVVSINFLQNTSSGKKKTKQVSIYVNLEKMTTSFTFDARTQNGEYNRVLDNKIYLGNSPIYIQNNFQYRLAENNIIDDEFSIDKYEIVDYDDTLLTISEYRENNSGFIITKAGEAGNNTRILFRHIASGVTKSLEVYIVDPTGTSAPNPVPNKEDTFSANDKIKCTFNDLLKIKESYPIVRDILIIDGERLEGEYKISDNCSIINENGMFYLNCGATNDLTSDKVIYITIKSSYFDDNVTGGEFTVKYTVKKS